MMMVFRVELTLFYIIHKSMQVFGNAVILLRIFRKKRKQYYSSEILKVINTVKLKISSNTLINFNPFSRLF